MLKVARKERYRYHVEGKLTFKVSSGELRMLIGTPKTRLKEGKDGFNHPDLAKGAIANLFCWPGQRTVSLKNHDQLTIEPFTAYRIEHVQGEYSVEGQCYGQVEFSVS